MAHKIDAISLAHVYLDNINPRHDPIDNEPEIIAFLLILGWSHRLQWKGINAASLESVNATSP